MGSNDIENTLVFNELTETLLSEMKNNGTVPKNETFYTLEEEKNITLHDTTGQDEEGLMTQKAITDALEERVSKTTTINNKPLSNNISLGADDVDALPNTTKYGYSISLSIDSSTYIITAQLKDQDGNSIGNPTTIDLPLESVVVSGSYNNSTKEVVLTLEGGSTVKFSVADLVNGLASQGDLDSAVSSINSLSEQVSLKYTKPSDGIPKTDLDSNVQASLNKADTALQSVPSEYVTETELTAKDYETKTNVDEKIRLLSENISTINSVVAGIEEKNTQQDTAINARALSSDIPTKTSQLQNDSNFITEIKTINGNSLVGTGNIEIIGGGGGAEGVTKTQNANTIISAPANFLSYSGKVVTVKAGTRVVIPNGLNADGSPNNLDYTLPANATFDMSSYASGDQRYIAIQKDGTLITLMHPYGASDYEVFIQYSAPSMSKTYGRWFDLTNNVWKTTGDKGATWNTLYCCPIGSVSITSSGLSNLIKHKVPTDFSFTEMDKMFTDIKYQQLNNSKQAKLVSGSNIRTVNGYTLLGSSNINLMAFSSYDKAYTDAAANTTVTLRTYENEIKVVYFWFNATTNNKSLTVKDTWTGQNIAYMANISGYNQYHLATIFMPRNREYNFTTTIAAKYSVVKITC